jgi:hypothetical protein
MFSIALLGSCQKDIEGCTDATAVNYNPDANIDNSTCQYVPTLSTKPIIYDLLINAESGGVITSDGGSEITVRGICWGTSPNPTIANDTTIDGSGTGSFSSFITNLNFSSTYYLRAYATNSNGTGYGDELSFMTLNLVVINDPNFEQELIDLGYDSVIDGYVNSSLINNVDTLIVNNDISDLKGIEGFTSLKYLNVSGNFNLSAIDISNNNSLTHFIYAGGGTLGTSNTLLTALNVSNNTLLKELTVTHTPTLNALDISQNTALEYLNCWNNSLTSLDVTQNTALAYLECGSNQLTNLDVSQNTALTYLNCEDLNLTIIDVTNNVTLTKLWCSYNSITSLDLTNNTTLTKLYCTNNQQLTSLDLSNNTSLTHFYCTFNDQLTCLNLKNGNNQNILGNDIFAQVNTNLSCVEVDDPAWSTTNWPYFSGTTFSANCNYPAGCF